MIHWSYREFPHFPLYVCVCARVRSHSAHSEFCGVLLVAYNFCQIICPNFLFRYSSFRIFKKCKPLHIEPGTLCICPKLNVHWLPILPFQGLHQLSSQHDERQFYWTSMNTSHLWVNQFHLGIDYRFFMVYLFIQKIFTVGYWVLEVASQEFSVQWRTKNTTLLSENLPKTVPTIKPLASSR